jgi:SAM-dependent MidA family methyltransferase
MSLLERLKREIAAAGPISIDAYMARCLHDPIDGYYATRPALGEDGDFITAPMVSQMFGELIGLWAVETWRRMGAPRRVLMVEMGPGDGTLMSDALRAAKLAPDFLAAAELWLVETSKPLEARQLATLANGPLRPRWIERIEDLPDDSPLLLVGNEMLDCLPAAQFVRTADGVAERMVGLDAAGGLAFGLRPAPLANPGPADLPEGAVFEVSGAQTRLATTLANRVVRQRGAALMIDYGRGEPSHGDTLQGLKRHRKVEPLACPGEADLTVHVDFAAVCSAAKSAGAGVAMLTQGEFLRRLGIEARAATLAETSPRQADRIGRQRERLIGPEHMGELFKAACIHDPSFTPPGFGDAAWP